MVSCPHCGEPNPDRFRVCGMCGGQLAAAAPGGEVRKTVSIVFSDLKGSTSIGERLDTESVRDALTLYFSEMRDVLRSHGGTVEKYIGDAIMAVFGLPAVHEDDALRAVRAALEMQSRLAVVNETLERKWGVRLDARIGVNTGEVVAGDASGGQRLVSGDTVNTAARLEQAAPVGGVLIGASTYQLVKHAARVEPVEPLELKGKAARVAAYLLVELGPAAERDRRLDGPMIGRATELAALHRAYAETVDQRSGRLVTVLGAAGVGKSRLIAEFLGSQPPTTVVLRGRCLSYGEGITFWPVIEAIRGAAGIDEAMSPSAALGRLQALCADDQPVTDRLASIIRLSDADYPLEETFWAVRTLLQILGASEPVIVVLDDIHWAEPTLLDLIEDVGTAIDVPVVVITSARSDFLDERPNWGASAHDAVRIDLRPLSPSESHAIIGGLPGGLALPPDLVARIALAAEGNPLFVEQVFSMLVDGNVVARLDDGSWTLATNPDEIAIPPTVSALIEARLDQLSADYRAVLQEGSVIGVVFYPRAVEAMSPPQLQAIVDRAIDRLTRRQFVRPEPSTLVDVASVRFDHHLIQDAAYRSLLKRERANLHGKFAEWLENRSIGHVGEADEIIGYHLEQAAASLGDLGPLDEHGRSVARRASQLLAAAGRRAAARGDFPAAANLLGRAAALREPGDRDRVELQLELAEALAAVGEFDRSDTVVSEAVTAADGIGDDQLIVNAELVALFLKYTVDPQGRTDEVIRVTQRAIGSLEATGDHRGLVRAWRLLGWVHGTACQYGAAELAVEEAVMHARAAGDRRAETRNVMSLALSALYGPRPVPDAISLTKGLAVAVAGDRRAEGVVLCALAHLQALSGAFAEARENYGAARAILEELGGTVMAATVGLDSGRVELLAGDPAAAERELRHDYDVLGSIGERYTLSTVAGLLAEAVFRQGRWKEALDLTIVAEEMAADDDVESQGLWRRVRARVLASNGDLDGARTLAEEAVALMDSTDAPVMKANCRMDLASILRDRGESVSARDAVGQALALLEAKGDLVDVEVARELLDSLPGGTAGAAIAP